jgi:hypothetical protein
MKKGLLFIGLLCLLLLGACSGSSEPLKIDSVTLARDDGSGNPGETVTSFKPTDHIFYATVNLNHLETGLKVKLSWIAVDAAGQAPNTTVAEKEFTGLVGNVIDGNVSLPNDWPTGKYRLDIYLNDKLAQSVDFNVAA